MHLQLRSIVYSELQKNWGENEIKIEKKNNIAFSIKNDSTIYCIRFKSPYHQSPMMEHLLHDFVEDYFAAAVLFAMLELLKN